MSQDLRPGEEPLLNSRELKPGDAVSPPAVELSRVLETGAVAPRPAAPAADFVGREMAGYRLEEFVGAGGFSMVFRAKRLSDGGEVALKLPRVAGFVEHLKREALILARFKDPGVVPILAVHLDHDPPFLAMPYIEGHNLLLPSEAAPPKDIILAFMAFRKIAELVARMHEAEIVHGDLKPGNIRSDASGGCHILDLGLARQQVETRQVSTLRASVHSVTGDKIAGTLEFMAPEVMAGDKPGKPADVYALGVMLHHMVCGRPPAFGVSPATLNPCVPPGFPAFLRAMLHHDPAVRFPSAGALLAGIDRFIEIEKRCLHRKDGHASRRVALERWQTLARGARALFWLAALAAVVAGLILLTPPGMGLLANAGKNRGDLEGALILLTFPAFFLGIVGVLLGITTLNAWICRVPAKSYKDRRGHPLWTFMMQ